MVGKLKVIFGNFTFFKYSIFLLSVLVEYLNDFVNFVWNEDEQSNSTGAIGMSLLRSLTLDIELENVDDAINDNENITTIDEKDEKTIETDQKSKDVNDENQEIESDVKIPTGAEENNSDLIDDDPTENDENNEFEETILAERNNEATTMKEYVSTEQKTKNRTKVKIPPIWTPKDSRTNAAFIYLYFRNVSIENIDFFLAQ